MIYKQDLLDFGKSSLELFLKRYADILSCYRAEPSANAPDGLMDLMASVSVLEGDDSHITKLLAQPGFQDLPESTQFRMVIQSLGRSYVEMFLKLYDRGALDRLCILPAGEDLPQSALLQLATMRKAIEPEPKTPPTPLAAAALAPPVDPIDLCVREFYELGSTAFKAKYISDSRNRKVYDAAVSQGRI